MHDGGTQAPATYGVAWCTTFSVNDKENTFIEHDCLAEIYFGEAIVFLELSDLCMHPATRCLGNSCE